MSSSSSSSSSSSDGAVDKVFQYDEAHIELLNQEKPWMKDVKHFSKVRISALAAMKMLKHALAGVDKGRRQGTNPIEIMGLCIGKPEADTLIIMDTCPLPIEGTETKVVADDTSNAYMVQLMESMELRRKERFIGWYHSHPFDVTTYSHCHLSATDVQTQSLWQYQMPHWVAIVVDPLRSLAKEEPVFGAFRVYPPQHNLRNKNECPDGSLETDEAKRNTRWGLTYHRYYALNISYFMSNLGNRILDIMSRNNLWIRVLSSSSIMEPENRSRFSDRVNNATRTLSSASNSMPSGRFGRSSGIGGRRAGAQELEEGTQAIAELALEQVKGHISQLSKHYLFNTSVMTDDDDSEPSRKGAHIEEMKED